MEDPTPAIAARIARERRAREWSLDELSARSGVSKAMLSKVERGESSPTAALLGRIVAAFGLTLGALLSDPAQPGSRLSRADEQPVWRDPATGYLRRQVSPLSDVPVQLVEVELPPGQEVAFPASAYAFIRQLVWALAGTLEFQEGAVVHRLRAGDCLELGPPSDCVFRNRGRSACRYLVVVARR
jgi:transcriptional regulator with XRE-family HTH domain